MDAFRDAFFAQDPSERVFPFLAWIHKGSSPYLYHWHEDVELVCVLKGPMRINMRESHPLETGDILLIAANEPHCFFAEGEGTEHLAVRFSPQLVKPLLDGEDESLHLLERVAQVKKCSRDWPGKSCLKVRSILKRLYDEYTAKADGYQVAIRALIYELMLIILRELPADIVSESSRRTAQDQNFKRAVYFLAEHYVDDISLKDCADVMGLNMNYFSRFFRAHTGINFHEYLITLRLKKAEHLLRTTNLTVTEVVQQSGFQNVKTFNRVFKKAHGCAPREYRRSKAG